MNARKPCEDCDGPKPVGQGIRFCDDCRARHREQQKQKRRQAVGESCKACGGPKPLGKGRRLCDDCQELAEWRKARRAQAHGRMNRPPCRDCKGIREPGNSAYCARCREARAMVSCRHCHQPKPPSTGSILCEACLADPNRRDAHKRTPCMICGGPKEPGRGRQCCAKCGSPAARRARKAQAQRIYWQMRAEKRGEQVVHRKKVLGAWTEQERMVAQPAAPFVVWLAAAIRAEGGPARDVHKAAGLSDRRAYALRQDPDATIGLQIVDRALNSFNRSVMIDGKWLYRRLVDEAQALPGNGSRLLAYLDRAERVAHLADTRVEFLWDLYPALA